VIDIGEAAFDSFPSMAVEEINSDRLLSTLCQGGVWEYRRGFILVTISKRKTANLDRAAGQELPIASKEQ
jgi:hypothetical protein